MSLPAVQPADIAVGDYCRIWINCKPGSKMKELPHSGRVTDLNRSIVTIETYYRKKFVGHKERIISAWKASGPPPP